MVAPKFLSRNILGITLIGDRGDRKGKRICLRDSKQKFLPRLFVYLRMDLEEGRW